jgi:hypothetical protein
MSYPPFDFQDTDLSVGWTVTSSPTYPSDRFPGGKGVQGDGVDDEIRQAAVVQSGDGQKQTYAAWFKVGDLTSGTGTSTIMSQRVSDGQTAFTMFLGEGLAQHGRLVVLADNWVNELDARTSARYDDDTWHHFVGVIDATLQDSDLPNSIRVFVDGVKITSFFVGPRKTGSGYLGPEGTPDLTMLKEGSAVGYSDPSMISARPTIWRTHALSDAEATSFYSSELAEMSETNMILPPAIEPSIPMLGSGILS